MSVLISPNMSLPVPSVGTENGPNYAYDINSCLTLLDQHDHSPGRGVKITPAGLNINTTLSFQNNSASNLSAVTFSLQSSASLVSSTLSVAPGPEGVPLNDLWYNDGTNPPFKITSGGAVYAPTATISGISYTAGTFSFTQDQDALPTHPAALKSGAITLQPNVASPTASITLALPAGLATTPTYTLPPDPAGTGTNFLLMSQSGVMSTGALVDNSSIQYTSNQLSVKAGGITAAMLANQGLQQSHTFSSTGNFTVPANVTQVLLLLVGGGGGGASGSRNSTGGGGGGGSNPLVVPLSVTPGEVLVCTVGTGGAGGIHGGASGAAGFSGSAGGSTTVQIFAGAVVAGVQGGQPGIGSSTGGGGGAGPALTNTYTLRQVPGGGGGANLSAGSVGSGSDFNVSNAAGGAEGGAGGGGGGGGAAGLGVGGAGGAGAASGTATAVSGSPGGVGGGGGGGGAAYPSTSSVAGDGGAGGGGQVTVYWIAP